LVVVSADVIFAVAVVDIVVDFVVSADVILFVVDFVAIAVVILVDSFVIVAVPKNIQFNVILFFSKIFSIK